MVRAIERSPEPAAGSGDDAVGPVRVSERRACAVVGKHPSAQHLAPPVLGAYEVGLRACLRAFLTERPRWGWRSAAAIRCGTLRFR